ncbi:MAG: redox-sensing transcriptional repressor Rex [Oscillospiraceae bacterium]|nr:redox-sensing transcriptional repressor Rex [Oscillospiraceae bacterium]
MKKKNVSDAVIRRMPRYYRYLDGLYNNNIVRISSSTLGTKMDITASQIRQDLSCFGEFGQQGYGYNVETLRAEIGTILGVDNYHKLIIIGVGNLGQALIQNFYFSKSGFTLDTAFDISPSVINSEINGVIVHSMDALEDYVTECKPDVAVLTVPRSVAQSTFEMLCQYGVRGFWNFTNMELTSEDPSIVVENVHFADSLLTLSYRIMHESK